MNKCRLYYKTYIIKIENIFILIKRRRLKYYTSFITKKMNSIISNNCAFNNDNTRNKIADGLINYILYHNETIRARSDQRSYLQEYFGDFSYDPYKVSEYITFKDRVTPVLDDKNKPVKIEKTKKFISVSPNIKKWLVFTCSRLLLEADMVFAELSSKLKSGSTNTSDLDSVMFAHTFEFSLFCLIAKVVDNNDVLLKKYMNIQLLESDIATKIKESYDHSHPMRQYNKNIADWLGKLLDDFFKVIAAHISLKNWFDRDATISEKNLPAVLWILAENTEYADSLYEFLSYVVPNSVEEKVAKPCGDLITFDMSNLTKVALEIKNSQVPVKKTRAKKGTANSAVTIPETPMFAQPDLTHVPTLPTLQTMPALPTLNMTMPTITQTPAQTMSTVTQPLTQAQQFQMPPQQMPTVTQPLTQTMPTLPVLTQTMPTLPVLTQTMPTLPVLTQTMPTLPVLTQTMPMTQQFQMPPQQMPTLPVMTQAQQFQMPAFTLPTMPTLTQMPPMTTMSSLPVQH